MNFTHSSIFLCVLLSSVFLMASTSSTNQILSTSTSTQQPVPPPPADEEKGGGGANESELDPPLLVERKAFMSPDRERLVQTLFGHYDNRNYPKDVTLRVGLTLMAFSVNEQSNVFETNSWLSMEWEDPRLAWNSSDFGGESHLSIPAKEIWIPDLVLLNSVDHLNHFPCSRPNLVLKNDGNVSWILPCHFRASCQLDGLEREPYGEQKCSLKFGCWTQNGLEVDLKLMSDDVDTSSFSERGHPWTVVQTSAFRTAIQYACCPESYVDVNYQFTIQRKNSTQSPSSRCIHFT